MAVQDDLATLFAKNLTLTQQPTPSHEDKIVYISQHYTHTAHISASTPTPIPPPRPTSAPDLADLEHVLRTHGVETTALTLPQVELFRRADDAQKTRLVQLWTICGPPAAPTPNSHSSLTWSATSLEQEEMLARRRYDELQQQQQQQQAVVVPEVMMSLDGTPGLLLSNSPGSVQSAESGGAWESASAGSPPSTAMVVHAHSYMEPYMQSGYEELARREYAGGKAALDPVYQGGMLDWERQQWMENQYGSFVGGWRDDEEML